MNRLVLRIQRELLMMEEEPPPGIACWCINGDFKTLKASLIGMNESPYEKGVFDLDISLTDRYPFEPPIVKFVTPIYHPNIDSGGRICLDLLKMPPKGSWKPSINLSAVLQSIQLLMNCPNPDDPLMADIAAEFRTNKQKYIDTAKSWTDKYAVQEKHWYTHRNEKN